MKITFIHHSSFLVETENLYLLFDYFQGTIPVLDPNKPLYVLASHSHHDHYNRRIFDLASRPCAPSDLSCAGSTTHSGAPENLNAVSTPTTTFLLGHDIDPRDIPPQLCRHVHILHPHETYEDVLLKVETLHSTDEGVAFWCTAADDPAAASGNPQAADSQAADGLGSAAPGSPASADSLRRQQIYHAGDHSNWIWEGTPHNISFVHMYHEELAHIAGRTADVAMIPMDPRLDKGFAADWYFSEFPLHRRADGWMQPQPEEVHGWSLTIQEYMQYADARIIFPMHQWGQFDLTDRFCQLKENAAYADRVVRIRRDGESWVL
jgi:L-ascorbate metabolism protein UlaG (beta-lactamase superfamily)